MVCDNACSKPRTEVYSFSFNGCIGLMAFILFILGIILASKSHLHDAFGAHAGFWVFGCFLFSALTAASSGMAIYGTRFHNKACLSAMVVLMVVLFFLQTLMAQVMLLVVEVDIDPMTQRECLQDPSVGAYKPQCKGYLESDLVDSFYLMWTNIYNQSLVDETMILTLTEIETTGGCCGFAPPNACGVYGNYSKPDGWETKVSKASCGRVPGYYRSTPFCKIDIADAALGTLVDGGCPFLMSARDECFRFAEEGVRGAFGCGLAAQEWARDQVIPIANLIQNMSYFQMVGTFFALCLVFRRKGDDVFPKVQLYGTRTFYQQFGSKTSRTSRSWRTYRETGREDGEGTARTDR